MAFEVDDDRSLLEDTIKELISAMKIETEGYALSDVRDLINEKLCEKASVDIIMFSHYCTKVNPEPLRIGSVSSCQNEQALASVR